MPVISMLDCFERIIVKAACKQDMYNSLKKFVFMHKKIAELLLSYLAPKTASCKYFQNVLMAELVGSQVRDRCLAGYLPLHIVTN